MKCVSAAIILWTYFIPAAFSQFVDLDVMRKNYGESYVRGYTAAQHEEYADAVKEFTQAIEEKPGVKTYYMSRAKSLLALQRNKEALEDVNKYAEILKQTDDKNDKTYLANISLMRGRAYEGLGKQKEAVQFYKDAIQLNGSLEGHKSLGELYRKQGKLELALDELIRSRSNANGLVVHKDSSQTKEDLRLAELIKDLQKEIMKRKSSKSLKQNERGSPD